jgi:hypothetical protein
MNHPSLRTRFLSHGRLAVVFLGLFAVVGCATTYTGDALDRARKSQPIEDREELQTTLGVSAERLAAIVTGPDGRDQVIDDLASEPEATQFICVSFGCACFGDADCNLMFTTVCADPGTNGSCSGEPPVCVCHP